MKISPPVAFLLSLYPLMCANVGATTQRKGAVVPPGVPAQMSTDESDASMFRNDYPSVILVAQLRCDKVEVVECIGKSMGYVIYRISGKVIEPFKGLLRKAQHLSYYEMIEAGYKASLLRGDRIVFLNYVRTKTGWVYNAMENSTHQATVQNIAVLRKLRFAQH